MRCVPVESLCYRNRPPAAAKQPLWNPYFALQLHGGVLLSWRSFSSFHSPGKQSTTWPIWKHCLDADCALFYQCYGLQDCSWRVSEMSLNLIKHQHTDVWSLNKKICFKAALHLTCQKTKHTRSMTKNNLSLYIQFHVQKSRTISA